MTLIHETGHELNKFGMRVEKDGKDYYIPLANGLKDGEVGYEVEQNIWGYDGYTPYDDYNEIGTDKFEKGHKNNKGVVEGVINEANKTEEGRKSLPTVPHK